jgi:hypothetical protein
MAWDEKPGAKGASTMSEEQALAHFGLTRESVISKVQNLNALGVRMVSMLGANNEYGLRSGPRMR